MFPEQIFHLHNFLINFRSRIIENVNDRKKRVGPKNPALQILYHHQTREYTVLENSNWKQEGFSAYFKRKSKGNKEWFVKPRTIKKTALQQNSDLIYFFLGYAIHYCSEQYCEDFYVFFLCAIKLSSLMTNRPGFPHYF